MDGHALVHQDPRPHRDQELNLHAAADAQRAVMSLTWWVAWDLPAMTRFWAGALLRGQDLKLSLGFQRLFHLIGIIAFHACFFFY